MVSIVVPVYNEKDTIKELHEKIVEVFSNQRLACEIIFVDDGSKDESLKIIKSLSPVKWVSFQRNYGATPALGAGIREAKGDVIVFLDADFQNDPADIPVLLQKIEEGCDVVVGWRKRRHDSMVRLVFSRLSNFLVRIVLGVNIHDFGCGIKAFKSGFIKNFYLWGDMQIFLVAVAKERGATIKEIEVSHKPRHFGSSKIKISRMVKTIFDLLAVKFIVKYFFKPFRFFGGWGTFFMVLSMFAFSCSIFLKLRHIKDFTETPLPEVGALFAILGVLLFMLGFLAEVLLRILYDQNKHSPYFIREKGENT